MEYDPKPEKSYQSDPNNNPSGGSTDDVSRLRSDSNAGLGKRSARRTSSCQALKLALLTLYRLDDFNLTHLGNGFFSEVYKVTHKVTDDVMVLKMNTIEDNRPNVLREVQLMNKMSHLNILKFLGVCVHRGQLHGLTEFIDGGSLHDVLCRDKSAVISWKDRVHIATHVASGMAYLHSKGVFHRDLTSRNVLVEVSGEMIKRAVVADFGLAAKIPDPEREFTLSTVGSPFWIAPECLHGHRYNELADVFSFGIILCEIIARIDADPEELPRTQNFGLDYIAFSELIADCPLPLLYLAFQCCQMEPSKRPKFSIVRDQLNEMSHTKLSRPKSPSVAPTLSFTEYISRHHSLHSNFANQRSYSDHSLSTVKVSDEGYSLPSARIIGKKMTEEDPLYQPAPANTNPFADHARLCAGRKLVASDSEREKAFDLSMTLPMNAIESRAHRAVQRISSVSLPDSPGVVRRAIEQFNQQIHSSQNQRVQQQRQGCSRQASRTSDVFDESMIESQYARHNNKQRNLECAMLFCGLDLIQLNKSSVSNWSDTQISSDLESEFHDDLEDVLRMSSSDLWDETDLATFPHTPDSAISDMESDWWLEQSLTDGTSHRYLHPTLIEKRRQLKHVESKQKEKLEQLHVKLERLRTSAKKVKKSKRANSSSVN